MARTHVTPARLDIVLLPATALAFAAMVALGLVVAPPDAVQGEVQRLMYVHVPAAWVAYLAFGVTALASLLYLLPRTRAPRWDRLAVSSAEVGLVFTGLTIALGSLWGRPVWGVWWTWDARLVTTALLFFLYLGYLVLRQATPDRDMRARRSAIVALVAIVDVPVVHLSVVWWRTLHQQATVLTPELDPRIEGSMAGALLAGFVAFTLAYVALTRLRVRVQAAEEAAADRALVQAIAERTSSLSPAHANGARP